MKHVESIVLAAESDEFEIVVVRAVPPTWRDVWSILRGTYQPRVARHTRLTVKGFDRVIREVWSAENIGAGLVARNPLLDLFSEV